MHYAVCRMLDTGCWKLVNQSYATFVFGLTELVLLVEILKRLKLILVLALVLVPVPARLFLLHDDTTRQHTRQRKNGVQVNIFRVTELTRIRLLRAFRCLLLSVPVGWRVIQSGSPGSGTFFPRFCKTNTSTSGGQSGREKCQWIQYQWQIGQVGRYIVTMTWDERVAQW